MVESEAMVLMVLGTVMKGTILLVVTVKVMVAMVEIREVR